MGRVGFLDFLTPKPPSDPQEARAVLHKYVADLQARGYDAVRAVGGEVKSTHVGGFLAVMETDHELADSVAPQEARAPSGALYHFVTSVWAGKDGVLDVTVDLQEDAEPGGQLTVDFQMSPDGTVL
jgi:hypothetical protein